LLVDDEEYLVNLWKKIIERHGYHVSSFTNALEALEEFQSNPDLYDIIITDQSMPKMSGLKLVEEILAIHKDIKIILCTGYLGDINYATNCNAFDILLKPFDGSTLIEAIQRNLTSHI
jgi:DNA-binding NtrC family response regulator